MKYLNTFITANGSSIYVSQMVHLIVVRATPRCIVHCLLWLSWYKMCVHLTISGLTEGFTFIKKKNLNAWIFCEHLLYLTLYTKCLKKTLLFYTQSIQRFLERAPAYRFKLLSFVIQSAYHWFLNILANSHLFTKMFWWYLAVTVFSSHVLANNHSF